MDAADGFYDESVQGRQDIKRKGRLRGGSRIENTFTYTSVLLLMFVLILHFGFVQMLHFNIIKAEWMRRGSQEDLEVQLQWGQTGWDKDRPSSPSCQTELMDHLDMVLLVFPSRAVQCHHSATDLPLLIPPRWRSTAKASYWTTYD